jgi:hypothetical protein
MNPDVPPLFDPDDDVARLMQDGLDPIPLSPARREALLRRILQRTGSEPPLAPAPPPEAE